MLATVVYITWKERNARLHQNDYWDNRTILTKVVGNVRGRLFSIEGIKGSQIDGFNTNGQASSLGYETIWVW